MPDILLVCSLALFSLICLALFKGARMEGQKIANFPLHATDIGSTVGSNEKEER